MGYASQLKLYRVNFKGQDHFFQRKTDAKAFGRKQGLKGVVVFRGPDHWRGESDGTSVQMRGKKSWVA